MTPVCRSAGLPDCRTLGRPILPASWKAGPAGLLITPGTLAFLTVDTGMFPSVIVIRVADD